MNPERRLRGPAHRGVRNFLRIIGPILLLTGIVLVATSILTVVLGDPFEHKMLAAAPFLGIPLIFVGLVMSSMGYMGAVARYQFGEFAPVGKDTFNYMAQGTRSGVRDIVGAVREGLTGEDADTKPCPQCEEPNDVDARFCDNCGQALPQTAACPECGNPNGPDARFCDQCGRKLL